MAFDTALNIVADCAVELGLVSFSSKPTDVFGSTNPAIGQLCQLLKSVGRSLLREKQWTQLQSFWLFSTTANQGRYALPSDFDRAIDQTAWNRSTRLPMGGPLSPQAFEFLSSRLTGTTYNLFWRLLQGKLHTYPDTSTPSGYVISYEYISRWWVVPSGTTAAVGPWLPGATYAAAAVALSGGNLYRTAAGGTAGSYSPAGTSGTITDGGIADWTYVSAAGTDAPAANADVLQFDPQLIRAALKLAFKAEKGFDTAAAENDYRLCLDRAVGADTVAPVLGFGRSSYSETLLGPWNLPTSGTAGQ